MIENRSDKKLRILETSERSGEVSKIGAEQTDPDKILPRPDPEVPAKAPVAGFQPAISSGSWSRPMGVNRVNGTCQQL